jgi:hypothetical protein
MDQRDEKHKNLKVFEHKWIKIEKTKANRRMFFVSPQNVILNLERILNEKKAYSCSQTLLDQELRVQNSW